MISKSSVNKIPNDNTILQAVSCTKSMHCMFTFNVKVEWVRDSKECCREWDIIVWPGAYPTVTHDISVRGDQTELLPSPPDGLDPGVPQHGEAERHRVPVTHDTESVTDDTQSVTEAVTQLQTTQS